MLYMYSKKKLSFCHFSVKIEEQCSLIKKILGYNIIFQNYINHGRNYIPQKPAQNYTKLYKIIQKSYRSQKNSGQAVEI